MNHKLIVSFDFLQLVFNFFLQVFRTDPHTIGDDRVKGNAGVKAEVGLENIKTVVTGGLGRIIANETDAVDIYDPNLTLKGINLVYKKQNRKIK